MTEFSKWAGFYAVMGSAAGALIGLQFVVMTLISQRPPLRASEVGSAFSTPNIVHFSVVLLVSALFGVPWETLANFALVSGAIGVAGSAYALLTARRMLSQDVYRPDLEDWLFHALLPLAAYLILALSALELTSHAREALFGFAGATLLLLFDAIHNAWDACRYHVLSRSRRPE
jgi:energy-converting hydrogenase Eha subunit A